MEFVTLYTNFLLACLSRFTDYFKDFFYVGFSFAIFFLSIKVVYMCLGGGSRGRNS